VKITNQVPLAFPIPEREVKKFNLKNFLKPTKEKIVFSIILFIWGSLGLYSFTFMDGRSVDNPLLVFLSVIGVPGLIISFIPFITASLIWNLIKEMVIFYLVLGVLLEFSAYLYSCLFIWFYNVSYKRKRWINQNKIDFCSIS